MGITLALLSEPDAASAQANALQSGFQISFDGGNQLFTFYPDMEDLPGVWSTIESVRQGIANMGFTDAAPILQTSAYGATLTDSVTTSPTTYSGKIKDWAVAYSFLGLDPPGDDPTAGDPLTIDTAPDGTNLIISFDDNTQTIQWNPNPGGSGRSPEDVRADIESVRARITELGFTDATPNAEAGWFNPPVSEVEVSGFSLLARWAYNWVDTYVIFGLEPPE